MFMMSSMPGYFPYKALYYAFDKKEKMFKKPVLFSYRTYDDQQSRTFVSQRQVNQRVNKSSLSIETNAQIPFDNEGKIYSYNEEKEYRIEEVEKPRDNERSLQAMVIPNATPSIQRLHLNKAR